MDCPRCGAPGQVFAWLHRIHRKHWILPFARLKKHGYGVVCFVCNARWLVDLKGEMVEPPEKFVKEVQARRQLGVVEGGQAKPTDPAPAVPNAPRPQPPKRPHSGRDGDMDWEEPA